MLLEREYGSYYGSTNVLFYSIIVIIGLDSIVFLSHKYTCDSVCHHDVRALVLRTNRPRKFLPHFTRSNIPPHKHYY